MLLCRRVDCGPSRLSLASDLHVYPHCGFPQIIFNTDRPSEFYIFLVRQQAIPASSIVSLWRHWRIVGRFHMVRFSGFKMVRFRVSKNVLGVVPAKRHQSIPPDWVALGATTFEHAFVDLELYGLQRRDPPIKPEKLVLLIGSMGLAGPPPPGMPSV